MVPLDGFDAVHREKAREGHGEVVPQGEQLAALVCAQTHTGSAHTSKQNVEIAGIVVCSRRDKQVAHRQNERQEEA